MILELTPGGSYAPCMTIVAPVSQTWRDRIRRYLVDVANAPDHSDTETALLSDDELSEYCRPAAIRDLSAGWSVRIRVDTWEALHLFGYDCHTLAE